MNKVLCTGAPGWLGTQFVKELVNENREVRCIVYPLANTKELEDLGVEIIKLDLTTFPFPWNITRDIDTVFHIAGIIHPKRIKDLFNVNFLGTCNLLASSIVNNIKRFVYVSSNSVAGTNIHKILFNEYNSTNPYMAYGKSKYLAEHYVRGANYSIETVILRPCWFYGPNQPDRQTKLFKMIKKGKPIIFGDGNNLRSMSYIGNVIQGLLLAESVKKASGNTYWITDGRPYTTNEIYSTIAELLDVKIKPRYIPNIVSYGCRILDKAIQRLGRYSKHIHVAGEMNLDIACSIEKAVRELGYKPKVSLREGMKRSIEWCKQNGKL